MKCLQEALPWPHHQVGIADVMLDEATPQDDHAAVDSPHRLAVYQPDIYTTTETENRKDDPEDQATETDQQKRLCRTCMKTSSTP